MQVLQLSFSGSIARAGLSKKKTRKTTKTGHSSYDHSRLDSSREGII